MWAESEPTRKAREQNPGCPTHKGPTGQEGSEGVRRDGEAREGCEAAYEPGVVECKQQNVICVMAHP